MRDTLDVADIIAGGQLGIQVAGVILIDWTVTPVGGSAPAEEPTVEEPVVEEVVKIPSIYLPTQIGKEGSDEFAEIFNDLTHNVASDAYAHAENFKTTASGYASHAEGLNSVAEG